MEKSGAGPSPIPGKDVTVEQFVEALKFVQQPHVKEAAERIQKSLSNEDGCTTAIQSFHANLPLARMRSDLEESYAACYRLDQLNLHVSHPVAQVLLSAGVIDEAQFHYLPTHDWHLTDPNKNEVKMEDPPHIDYIHFHSTTDRKKNERRNHVRRRSCSALESFVTNMNNPINPVIKPAFSKSQWNDDDHVEAGEISLVLRNASLSSGYPPEVCEKILNEFEQIKSKNAQRHHSTSNL